jgi:acetoin utilization protein AcuC
MFGLGTEDNPVFPGMHEASALVAGATLAAARAVWSGSAGHGASIAGGMHHAMAAHASGFGVYNDPAVAIAWLLGHGAERIAYVDIDAHHGDGVQAAFYADPRVLTISVHEHPETLFPFTGLPAETGGPGAEGSAVNVALPAGPGIPPGCAPSTRSSRRCCGSSGRRCWSASTAATRTGWIPCPTWS